VRERIDATIPPPTPAAWFLRVRGAPEASRGPLRGRGSLALAREPGSRRRDVPRGRLGRPRLLPEGLPVRLGRARRRHPRDAGRPARRRPRRLAARPLRRGTRGPPHRDRRRHRRPRALHPRALRARRRGPRDPDPFPRKRRRRFLSRARAVPRAELQQQHVDGLGAPGGRRTHRSLARPDRGRRDATGARDRGGARGDGRPMRVGRAARPWRAMSGEVEE
jgi:hypothetical protein